MSRFLNCTLGVFLSLYAICSVAVLGVGVWLVLYHTPESILFGEDVVKTTGYALIIAGGILLLSVALGSLMSCYRSKILVVSFLICMLISATVLFSIGGFMIYVRSHLTNSLKNEMEHILNQDYGFESTLTNAWDSTQWSYHCCGVTGPETYASSRWIREPSEISPRTNGLVPDSCCKRFENQTYVDLDKCHASPLQKAEPYLNTLGCYELIRPVINKTLYGANIFVFVMGGLALLVSFALIIALCVTRGEDV